MKYGRDIFKDLMKLEKALNENAAEDSNLDLFSLETFENIAYLMAKHADPSLPDTAEEWLDEFSVFSIYQVLPEIITLWGLNVQTQSVSKKTARHRAENDDPALPAQMRPAWNLHPGPGPSDGGAGQ